MLACFDIPVRYLNFKPRPSMHHQPLAELSRASAYTARPDNRLDFLWLELTNRCNLKCVHCYTESSPFTGERDLMTAADYESVMRQAYDLGCRKMQFIGGEPQLNEEFLPLLMKSKDIGFEFVEVFSNLTRLSGDTVSFCAANNVHFATSVYSDVATQHDSITTVRSSHARTVSNLRTLVENGITTRASIIVVDQTRDDVERTKLFLKNLGVSSVRDAQTREFGRGEEVVSQGAQLSGLCGHCWAGKLCVAPDGVAYPCVMARHWAVGNVMESTLAEVVRGQALTHMRKTIFDDVWTPRLEAYAASCMPGGQEKESPDDDYPGKEREKPSRECPQSCSPDESTCGPASCPQSCEPFIVVCEPTGDE
jgi:MoaA/NifB/PqqE/SkfB family radical SAM enzyme